MEDQRRGQQRLSDDFLETELRQLVDVIPQQIFVLSSDGDVLYVNQVLLKYYRLTLQAIKSRDVRAGLVHPDDLEGIGDELKRGLSGRVPFEMEGRFRRHDGQYRWFLIRLNQSVVRHADRHRGKEASRGSPQARDRLDSCNGRDNSS